MKQVLRSKRSRRRCGYTQRWQAETVMSMMKRNLGSALRGKSARSRHRDLRLKVLIIRCQRSVETVQDITNTFRGVRRAIPCCGRLPAGGGDRHSS